MRDEDKAFLDGFDPATAGIYEWACMYRLLGLQVLPGREPNPDDNWKVPSVRWKSYQSTDVAASQFDKYFKNSESLQIGTLTGLISNIKVLDLDDYKNKGAKKWYDTLLHIHNNGMNLETWTQQTGGGGRQLFFRPTPGRGALKTGKIPTLGVDVRDEGGWTMLPPSRHVRRVSPQSVTTVRGQYSWFAGFGPWEIEPAEMPVWLYEALEALLGAERPTERGAPTPSPEGEINAFGRRIDGREDYMTRLIFARVVDMYRESPILPPRAELEAHLMSAFQLYDLNSASRAPSGGTNAERLESERRGLSLFREKWAYVIGQWNTKVAEAAAKPKTAVAIRGNNSNVIHLVPPAPAPEGDFFDPWAPGPPLPSFPLDTLPGKVATYCKVTARNTGGDPSAVAMTCLAVACGAIDQSFRIRMKAGQTGTWFMPPRLWVALVGDPSSKKSPILNAVSAPLIKIQTEAFATYRKILKKWEREGKDAGEPEPPPPARYVVQSITTNKIADILARQKRGVLSAHDELGSWFGEMDRYHKGGADKNFWLTAYNGGSYFYDTVGKGEKYIENLCVSIVGGIQPEAFKQIKDLAANGLIQRFIVVMLKQGEMSENISEPLALMAWEQTLQNLILLPPACVNVEEGAQDVFLDLEEDMLGIEKNENYPMLFRTLCGKLKGLIGSIALILHLLDGRECEPVGMYTAIRAKRIIDEFIIPHIRAFYDEIDTGTQSLEETRQIASFILRSDIERFTGATFARSMNRGMRNLSASELSAKLSPLVTGGWLTEEFNIARNAQAWVVAPGLRAQFAERREAARRAAAEILERWSEGRARKEERLKAAAGAPAPPDRSPTEEPQSDCGAVEDAPQDNHEIIVRDDDWI